jgi:prolyl-tRNA synthetase
VRWTLIHV